MKLESMLANLPPDKRIAGALSGVVDLAARGRSPDEWLASAAGSVSARLHGGSMSRRLDAQLGLSGSRFLRALFTGSDERVPIRCAAAEMELRAGQARSRSLLIETESTHVSGIGTANLKSGAFDLLLTPSPERSGLLELRKSIQLHGKPGSKLAIRSSMRRHRRGGAVASIAAPSRPVIGRRGTCARGFSRVESAPAVRRRVARPLRSSGRRIDRRLVPQQQSIQALGRQRQAAIASTDQVDAARQPGPAAAAA